jgi:hypothetical protein
MKRIRIAKPKGRREQHWHEPLPLDPSWEHPDKDDPGTAAGAPSATYDCHQGTHDGRDSGGGSAIQAFPARPRREVSRPSTAPAYYLGRPARLWITAMRPASARLREVLVRRWAHPAPSARNRTASPTSGSTSA